MAKIIVTALDTMGNTEQMTYVGEINAYEALVTAVMYYYYHCANWWDERVRAKVTPNISFSGTHHVWACPDSNIHYLSKED